MDYKEMYFKMFWTSEQIINKLIAAQLECEERYVSMVAPEFELYRFPIDNKGNVDKE